MSQFNATLTIRVPAALEQIAASIARALDPDLGGANSFRPDETMPAYLVCTTPCREGFRETAMLMMQNPALLYTAVASDYALRWAGLTPPTAEECAVFAAAAILE